MSRAPRSPHTADPPESRGHGSPPPSGPGLGQTRNGVARPPLPCTWAPWLTVPCSSVHCPLSGGVEALSPRLLRVLPTPQPRCLPPASRPDRPQQWPLLLCPHVHGVGAGLRQQRAERGIGRAAWRGWCSGRSMRVCLHLCMLSPAPGGRSEGPPPVHGPARSRAWVPVGEACSPKQGDPDVAEAVLLVQSWLHGAPGHRVRGRGQAAWGPKGRGQAMLCLAVHKSHKCHSILLALPGHPRSSRGRPGPCGCRLPPRRAAPRCADWGAARPAGASPSLHPSWPHVLRVPPCGAGAGGGGPRLSPRNPV